MDPQEITDADKAARMLEAGHVTPVDSLPNGTVLLEVQSATTADTYRVSLNPKTGETTCTCRSTAGHCWHRTAVELWGKGHGPAVPPAVDAEIVEDDTPSPPTTTAPPATGSAMALHTTDDLSLMMLSDNSQQRASAWGVMKVLAGTEFVPKALRGKPEAVMAAVFLGAEYGLGPLDSLRAIDVIQGNVEPNAELKLRLYRRAGHKIIETVWLDDPQGVRITGERVDGEQMTVVYTWADAERAKLTGKDVWKQNPDDMLWARAVTRLVRRLAPDCLDERTPLRRSTS